uniref:SFRICE_010432 n=1 Tax=Spodoptera frugiperda TaxID=7108 RepID=A0A2H1VXF1_SPOFR
MALPLLCINISCEHVVDSTIVASVLRGVRSARRSARPRTVHVSTWSVQRVSCRCGACHVHLVTRHVRRVSVHCDGNAGAVYMQARAPRRQSPAAPASSHQSLPAAHAARAAHTAMWRPLHALLLLPALLLLWNSSAEAGPLFESLSLLPGAGNVSQHLQHQLAALDLLASLAGLASLAADTADTAG